jgi:hypothetical protein
MALSDGRAHLLVLPELLQEVGLLKSIMGGHLCTCSNRQPSSADRLFSLGLYSYFVSSAPGSVAPHSKVIFFCNCRGWGNQSVLAVQSQLSVLCTAHPPTHSCCGHTHIPTHPATPSCAAVWLPSRARRPSLGSQTAAGCWVRGSRGLPGPRCVRGKEISATAALTPSPCSI